MELVDESERLVAQIAARAIRKPRHRLAVDVNFTRTRRIETAEDMQQRAFARAGRSDDRHRLAAAYRNADVAQHFRAQLSFLVRLRDLVGAKDNFVGHALPRAYSFVTERCRGFRSRRPPCRVQRREHAEHERGRRDPADVGPVQIARKLADVVDIGRKECDVERVLDPFDDALRR